MGIKEEIARQDAENINHIHQIVGYKGKTMTSLVAKNRQNGRFNLDTKLWLYLLNSGPGLALGHSRGLTHEQYIFDQKRGDMVQKGGEVSHNEAVVLARLTRSFLVGKAAQAKQFEQLPDEQQKELIEKGDPYALPLRVDHFSQLDGLIVWIRNSGGFEVKPNG